MTRLSIALLPAALLIVPAVFAQAVPDASIRTVAFANSSPTGYAPRGGSWSPDGSRFTFVASDAQIGQPGDIVQIDAATGRGSVLATAAQLASLSTAEIDEKDRDHRERYGMSSYLWAGDSKHLLLDKGGRLWMYDIASGTGSLVVDTGAGSGDDPKFSPDAKSVSYLRDHNLFVHRVDGKGAESALTSSASGAVLNGEVDWVYLEELDVKSNYFWSPDSAAVAYLQMNEARVPVYPIEDWIPGHATLDGQRYPQPGDPNPGVRVGVVAATGGATTWVEMPFSMGNDYIPRFGWVDANTVYVEVLTRDQKHRNLYFADAKTGKSRLMYAETDEKYINFDYDVMMLPKGRFVASSWRDGFTHLYLYRFDEKQPMASDAVLVRRLTTGEFDVFSADSYDAATDTLYVTSDQGDPLDSNLWAVKLDGSAVKRVTSENGAHDTTMSPDHRHFADVYSTFQMEPVARLCAVGGACGAFWKSNPVPAASGVTSSIVTFVAADGKTKLYGTVTMPTGRMASGSVPLIMNPYGGPLPTPGVSNSWGSPYFNELLAQHGFAVLTVDNRGGGGRGREFQQVAYRNFGAVQFSDQMAALDQALAKWPVLDAKRIGWWGWSWGGSFTLWAMEHTDRIKAGVAVAPVTDQRNYDTIYTERYLGLPGENKAAYDAAATIAGAKDLKGRLMIAHGTGDDNVHMANTIQFVQALIDAGIPYDLQLFPRRTHSIAGEPARNELFNRILYQFESYLK